MRWVAEFNLDNPVGKSVLVNQSGFVLKGFVDFNNGAANRRDEVAGCLYAFNGAKFFACFNFVVNFGHVNVNHCAKSVLCIVADANICYVAFNFNVFVCL